MKVFMLRDAVGKFYNAFDEEFRSKGEGEVYANKVVAKQVQEYIAAELDCWCEIVPFILVEVAS